MNTNDAFKLANISGHQHSVRLNLFFTDRDTLFYLSGQLGVFHNLSNRMDQKFVNMCEGSRVTAVAFGSNNWLAVASSGKSPAVSMFNMKTRESKVLPKPEGIASKEYVFLSFSDNNSLFGGQQDGPDWPFVLWNLEKRRIDTIFHPFRMQTEAEVYKFAFCPHDPRSVVAVGRHFVRFYHHKDGPNPKIHETAVQHLERSHRTFHCVAWVEGAATAIGTSEGDILMLEEGKLVREVSLTKQLSSIKSDVDDKKVTAMLSTDEGMICSYGNFSVLIMTCDFKILKILKIPDASTKSYLTQLVCNSDYIAATTKDGRILYYNLAKHLKDNLFEYELHVLQDFQHTRDVTCADAVENLPLRVSCSSSTLILRDIRNGNILVRYGLGSTPRSVSLHPLGTNVVVAFEKQTKFYNILLDTLAEENTFENTTEVSQVAFAPSGHIIAIAEGKHINLFYSIGFKKLSTFARHHSDVKIMVWKNDNCLLSSDANAILYEWNVLRKMLTSSTSLPGLAHTSLVVSSLCPGKILLYVASSDRKIRLIQGGSLMELSASTSSKVTAMALTETALVAGTEKGTVLIFSTLLKGPFFETQCHSAGIIHISVWGTSVLAEGADGIMSTWKGVGINKDNSTKSLEEVLTEIDKQKSLIQRIDELAEELRFLTQRTNEGRSLQETEQRSEIIEDTEKYKSIQASLQAVIENLKNEIQQIEKEEKENTSNKITTILKNMKENEEDFKDKLFKEEEFLNRAIAERMASFNDLKRRTEETLEEKRSCLAAFEQRYSELEEKVRELEEIVKQEVIIRQGIETELEDFYKGLESKQPNQSDNQQHQRDSYKREQKELRTKIEEANTQLAQEKEPGRFLDGEMKRKQNEFKLLEERTEEIARQVDQVNADISRMKRVIKDKGEMKQKLDEDIVELSVEAEDHLSEYEKEKQKREQELMDLRRELQKCRDSNKIISVQLQKAKREEVTLNEHLKSTEISVKENDKQLFAAELLLDRCRSEFVSLTSDCTTKASLRRVLLKLYDKMDRKTNSKEETVFDEDVNPYTCFYRQRDHYESLINVVRSRTSQIKETFRVHFVKLAKENSDWTSFAESLRSDIRQQHSRIRALEEALGMDSGQFRSDPAETRRRLESVAESLTRVVEEEQGKMDKKKKLSDELGKEVRRLHGLLTVGEKGRKVRKMNR